MRLAWQNLLHDRVRFVVTAMGVAFAVFLMIFQGSLLLGFLRASSKLVDATEADLWITARGVLCFDFSAPLPRRFLETARGIEGVAGAARIVTSYAQYRTPEGRHHVVALVGAEAEVGRRFPLPRRGAGPVEPDAVVLDASSAAALGADTVPQAVEINRRRANVIQRISGFSSFLGAPYVFTSYRDALRYLGLGQEESMYILLRVAAGHSAEAVRQRLRARLPEADVWTHAEFSRRSKVYWVMQTGAGAAILTAALLGFLIGVIVVSQTIYATTMENLEEFATLKAIGATRGFVIGVVLIQAMTCGVFGCLMGLAATFPAVDATRGVIPWVYTPGWLPAAMLPPSLLMCAAAALISIRTALQVEPARVFRA